MSYSVRFTGGYGEGEDPAAVAAKLAATFRLDAAAVTRLISAKATVKRGVDREIAQRFKSAIDGAGAGCAIDDEEEPLTLDVPVATVASASAATPPDHDIVATEAEVTIFDIGPAAASYAGSIALGTLLLPLFGLGLLVWLSAFISCKSSRYRLTNQRLFARKGWLSRQVQELELYRVQDVALHQTMLDRLFGIGTIDVIANDPTTPRLTLPGIKSPDAVKEDIRNAYRTSRRREGVGTAERIID
jgi:membrane protein YdbS with pleckstrin-like domain